MPSIIVYEFLSLDGYFEGPSGREMEFVQSSFLPSMEYDIAAQYGDIEALIMGRRTFDALASYWPTDAASGEHLLGYMNGLKKLVVSSHPDVSAWENSEHLGNDPMNALRECKHSSARDLMVIGSGIVVRELVRADLVDEFRFLIFPLLLGDGRRLFDTAVPFRSLRLCRNHRFENGTLALHYDRVAA
ncbi:dihydrofolate reductase family protein [Qingshengfaniella alkalisoli]|uniref:Dihydrofolate reductase n=1 Tax=Qingshengfaniella alkalisoli TaxID=2599296 RepID=A0A5B8JA51_9RHOB|nr:dihydrofolate reductase family protein [Qingshengfaniella alkalisoli]QDY71090.1 dihydrofolate reductase [Qingshengfaniella alkalisoli]